jgi:hypothetical protein
VVDLGQVPLCEGTCHALTQAILNSTSEVGTSKQSVVSSLHCMLHSRRGMGELRVCIGHYENGAEIASHSSTLRGQCGLVAIVVVS